jgi:single-stranded-DNA-specific exonuclease
MEGFETGDFEGFCKRAQELREKVAEMKSPIVVNHYDCDGLTSGSIACKFLEDNDIPYRIKTIRKVDDKVLEELDGEKEIIFTDLGGGNVGVNDLRGEVVIVDHHQTRGIEKLQLNPHLFGFDGGTDACAATTAFYAFEKLPEVAITGAVGDMQYPLRGLNKILLAKLEKEGRVKASIDLRFYGKLSRPLPQLLAYADDPYLPGLGGDENRCVQFLEGIGIRKNRDRWQTYYQLQEEQKKRLIGSIATYLTEYFKGEYEPGNLVGETYVFPRFESIPQLYDAGEFSTMLNACGRHEQTQVGIDICLRREGSVESGIKLLEQHKKMLREGIEYAYKRTKDWRGFLFLDARGVIDDGIIGVVAGMVYLGVRKKPILAISSDSSGKIKISTRGTKKLVENGLNLGVALSNTTQKIGGFGGGHNIAAGASIEAEKLDEFLIVFSEEIRKQVANEQENLNPS